MPSCFKKLFCGCVEEENRLTEIPISGNAFICEHDSSPGPGRPAEVIGETGMERWASSGTVWSIFFRLSLPDEISISLRLRIPKDAQSSFFISCGDEPIKTEIKITDAKGGEYQNIFLCQRVIKKVGYVRINLQGLARSGHVYADVSHLLVATKNTENEIIFNVAEDSYWGRRGPSIHLSYSVPEDKTFEFYYNEVTVPAGSDAIGLYAMAIGFEGGYFGIQVNGPSERRVLFSVWSAYQSDDPNKIPKDYRVSTIKEGNGVTVRQFGDEGSGAQSYMDINWDAGATYKFLVHGRPIDQDSTLFTGWLKRPESEPWQLIASFRKPKVSLYLKGFHSFLENFKPDLGSLERRAYYGNQWGRDTTGQWHELVEAEFTGDGTAKAGRRDFAGGLGCLDAGTGGNLFYLRHCGFFDEMVPINQTFKRAPHGRFPQVEIENLV